MKVISLNIPASYSAKFGLPDIKLDRLEDVVLLTGKNGSGKTHMLMLLYELLNDRTYYDDLKRDKESLTRIKDFITVSGRKLKLLKRDLFEAKAESSIKDIQRSINKLESLIKSYEVDCEILENKVSNCMIRFSPDEISVPKSLIYMPRNLNISFPDEMTRGGIKNGSNSWDEKTGFEETSIYAFARLQHLQDVWREAILDDSEKNTSVKKGNIENYERLCDLVDVFLGTKLERDASGEATLFGLPLSNAGLSDGQKKLLMFALAMHSQALKLNDTILLIDEPENYLHPNSALQFIERLLKINSIGQIWIATHSISILSSFDSYKIWFVNNGVVSHAGKIPDMVLATLLGDNSRILKLLDFLSLPQLYAFNKFVFECLSEPFVASRRPKDPQSEQVKDLIFVGKLDRKIKVLDFGAGKCRLLGNLSELFREKSMSFSDLFDYVAFDEFSENNEIARCEIDQVYGKSVNRFFFNSSDVINTFGGNSFDLILLCNVLHEIDPHSWLEYFGPKGFFTRILSKDGSLIIVEDYSMPFGERAFQNGFLVLDTEQILELFKIKNISESGFRINDYKNDGRLKAHVIPYSSVVRVDRDSRHSAIVNLKSYALSKIKDLRGPDGDYVQGRKLAFWTQQFANASLCESEL